MLTFVPFTPAHFATLASWFQSERDVAQWGGAGLSWPLDADQLQAMLNQGQGAKPERLCWMIAKDGLFIGHIQVAFDWVSGSARIGRFVIAPYCRGQGMALLVLKAMSDRIWALPEIERLCLHVFTWNEHAAHLYAKFGFIHEGVARSSVKVGNERWDMATMSILRSERSHVTGSVSR